MCGDERVGSRKCHQQHHRQNRLNLWARPKSLRRVRMRGHLFGRNQMCRGVRERMVVVVRSSFSIIEMGARGYFKLVPYRSGFCFFFLPFLGASLSVFHSFAFTQSSDPIFLSFLASSRRPCYLCYGSCP